MADVAELAIRARTQGVQRANREVKGLQGASAGASKAVRALGAGLAALGAGAAVRAIRENIRQTARISELGDVAGVSAERIQELSKSFSDMAGIAETVTQGALRRFNRRLGLAEDGTGAAGDTFDQLGISIKNAGGEMRSTQSVLDEAIARLVEIENESRRAARASEFFGEDAGPQMAAALGQGSEALREQIRELHEQGRVLSNETVQGAREANDELNRMSDILSTEFARRIAANSESILAVAEGLMSVAEVGLDAAGAVQTFGEALGFMAGQIVHGPLLDSIPEMRDRLNELKDERASLREEFEGNEDLPAFQARMEQLNTEIDSLSSRLQMAQNRVDQMNGPIEVASLNTRTLKEEMEILGDAFPEFQVAAMDVRTLGEEFEALDGTLNESLFRIASDGVQAIRDQVNPGRAELRNFREQLQLLNLAEEKGIISSEEYGALQRQLNDQLSDQATDIRTLTGEYNALDAAVDRAAEKQNEFGRAGQQSMKLYTDAQAQTVGAIGQMFGNMAEIAREGGKDQFETWKRLAQAQAAVNASLAISNALAVPPPPVGIALAGTIGGLAAIQIAQIESQEYQPRRTGGQVRSGQSYLVGEEGPEVVTMNGGGHVTPNHQLQGGNSNNVTQVFQLSDNARREAKQQILESAPMIRNMAKQAVIEAAQNGGAMSRTVGARS